MQNGVPVDQPLAAVDESLVIQADKHFLHSPGKALIHGETFPAPVHGRAQAPGLAGDGVPGMLFPVPHRLNELFPAQVMP